MQLLLELERWGVCMKCYSHANSIHYMAVLKSWWLAYLEEVLPLSCFGMQCAMHAFKNKTKRWSRTTERMSNGGSKVDVKAVEELVDEEDARNWVKNRAKGFWKYRSDDHVYRPYDLATYSSLRLKIEMHPCFGLRFKPSSKEEMRPSPIFIRI